MLDKQGILLKILISLSLMLILPSLAYAGGSVSLNASSPSVSPVSIATNYGTFAQAGTEIIHIPIINGGVGLTGQEYYYVNATIQVTQSTPGLITASAKYSNGTSVLSSSTFSANSTRTVSYRVPINQTFNLTTDTSNFDPTIIFVPTNIVSYIPIQITNNQPGFVAANTPLAVGVSPSGTVIGQNALAYQAAENPLLSNIEYFWANGTIVPSWMEGNILNELASNALATSFASPNALGSSANVLTWVEPQNNATANVINFNGASSHIDTGLVFNSNTFSVSAWVYSPTTGSQQPIIGNLGNLPYNGWYLTLRSGGAIWFSTGHNGGVGGASWSGPYSADTWYHLVGVDTNGNLALYVDGVFATNGISPFASNEPLSVKIGEDNIGEYFDGQIADVQLYNTTLTSAQVNSLYQEGFGGAPLTSLAQNVVMYLPMNGLVNGNVIDYSGNSNNGVPTNIAFTLSKVPAEIGIAPYNTITLYEGFAGNTISSANTLLNGVQTGEAPQLSCDTPWNTMACGSINSADTYAKYDNGNQIFSFYDGLKGTTRKSGYTVTNGGGGTVNNGIIFSSTSSGNAIVITSGFSNTTIEETLPLTAIGAGGGIAIYNTPLGGGNCYSFFSTHGNEPLRGCYSGIGAADGTANPFSLLQVAGMAWFKTGSELLTSNYALNYQTANVFATNSLNYYGIGFGGLGTSSGSNGYQWFRVRNLPANNILPSTSFGSLTFYTYNTPTIGVSNVMVDGSQYLNLTTHVNDQSRYPFTINTLIFNSTTHAIIASNVVSVSSNTASFLWQVPNSAAGNLVGVNSVVTDGGGVTENTVTTSNILLSGRLVADWGISSHNIVPGNNGILTANIIGGTNSIITGLFNGARPSYISAGTTGLPIGSSSRTFFAWIYLPSYPSSYGFIYSYGSPFASPFGEQSSLLMDGSQVYVQGYGDDFPTGLFPSLNAWHFVGYTYNGIMATVYLDGKQYQQSYTINTVIGPNPLSIGVEISGGSTLSYPFNGLIADVQIYNSSLSANEVASLYDEGIGGAPQVLNNLVGWWLLNGNANTIGANVMDYSPNQNMGTPTAVAYQTSYNAFTYNEIIYASNGLIMAQQQTNYLPNTENGISATGNTLAFSTIGWALGTYTANLIITDSATTQMVATNTLTFNVANYAVANIIPASNSILQGQSQPLSSNGAIGGTAPYTYQWFSECPTCGSYTAIAGATNNALYTFTTTQATQLGTWSFILQGIDSSGSPLVANSIASTISVFTGTNFQCSSPLMTILPESGIVYTQSDAGNTLSIYTTAGMSPVSTYLNGTLVEAIPAGAIGSTSPVPYKWTFEWLFIGQPESVVVQCVKITQVKKQIFLIPALSNLSGNSMLEYLFALLAIVFIVIRFLRWEVSSLADIIMETMSGIFMAMAVFFIVFSPPSVASNSINIYNSSVQTTANVIYSISGNVITNVSPSLSSPGILIIFFFWFLWELFMVILILRDAPGILFSTKLDEH